LHFHFVSSSPSFSSLRIAAQIAEMKKQVWSDPKKPLTANASTTDTNNTQSSTTQAETYVLQEDDMMSIHSFQTQNTFSSTDGIDVLGAPPPGNLVEWHANWTGRIITNRVFKQAVIVLLVLNSIIMGTATFDFVTENQELKRLFYILDLAFLSLFTGEIFLRIVHQRHLSSLRDPWLPFDTVIIATSWMCLAILSIRTFRVLRTMRLATKLKPLRDIVLSVGRAMKRIGAIFLLLIFSLYIYSIVFTDLFKETQQEFRRLDITSWTLIQIMTLDGWSDIAHESMAEKGWVWIIFSSFIATTVVLMSLLIAVVVEALMNLNDESIEKKLLAPIPEAHLDLSNDSQQAIAIARLESKVNALSQALDLFTKNQVLFQDALASSGGFAGLSFQRHRSYDASTIDSDDVMMGNGKYIIN